MAQFILRRIVSVLPVLLLVSFAAFSLIWLIPGDAAVVILGPDVDRGRSTRSGRASGSTGRSRPVRVVARKDAPGRSRPIAPGQPAHRHRRPRSLPATLELSALAMLIALTLGIRPASSPRRARAPGSTSWARWCRSAASRCRTSGSGSADSGGRSTGVAAAVRLRVAARAVRGNLELMIMPAVTLGWPSRRPYRLTRAASCRCSTSTTCGPRAPRARRSGASSAHALKNALIPVVTIVGLQIGRLAGGAVITETIFESPASGGWRWTPSPVTSPSSRRGPLAGGRALPSNFWWMWSTRSSIRGSGTAEATRTGKPALRPATRARGPGRSADWRRFCRRHARRARASSSRCSSRRGLARWDPVRPDQANLDRAPSPGAGPLARHGRPRPRHHEPARLRRPRVPRRASRPWGSPPGRRTLGLAAGTAADGSTRS